ncbi:hypothetical protein HDU67_003667, partial [Dinochytrium kinnereticum]
MASAAALVVSAISAASLAFLYNAIVPSRTRMMGDLSDVDPDLRKEYPEDYWTPSLKADLTHGKTHYTLLGPPTGPKLVLIHGLMACWAAMPTFVSSLVSKGYQILLYDTYGRGYSAAPGVTYDHRLYVTQLRELLDFVGWGGERVSLLGYSLGGGIATAFAGEFGERVERVVLVAPAGLME